MSAELESLIREELRRDGAMTFARYMQLALYHPQLGYYSSIRPPMGAGGDYYTSPDVSPLFGAALGRQLHQIWEILGRPDRMQVVELGAGKGTLAADILGWAGAAHPDLYAAIDYTLVETSPGLARYESAALARLPVRWCSVEDLPMRSVSGCFLSNEVADALPFHRVRMEGDKLLELWVEERAGELVEVPGELSTPEIARYLAAYGVTLRPGQTAEVSLQAPGWMRAQVERLSSGFVLAIDYGAAASVLYGERYPEGTLACYHRHTLNRNPFQLVGEQDITAHVNFTALARAAERAGASVLGYTSQGHFLAALGLGDALSSAWDRPMPPAEFARMRAAVEELIRPDGLGGFRVLAVSRGVHQTPLRGFSMGSDPV